MQDVKVRSILTRVRGMSVDGHSPVDYIDGVLAAIPNDNLAMETASPKKQPILGADYGPTDVKPLF